MSVAPTTEATIIVKPQEPGKAITTQEGEASQVVDVKKQRIKRNEEERKLQSDQTVSKKQKIEIKEV